MKRLRSVIANLSIAASISLGVVIVVSLFNPMMGFTTGYPFWILSLSACILSIVSGILLFAATFRTKTHKHELNTGKDE